MKKLVGESVKRLSGSGEEAGWPVKRLVGGSGSWVEVEEAGWKL